MKKTKLLPLLFLASLVFVYIACQRDKDGTLPSTPTVEEKVEASISGRVIDDQNLPIAGALVKAGNLSANTDLNGNFQIKNVTLDANAGFVKVEKTGFFGGSRTFKATKGSTHYVSVQLIKKSDAGSFTSASGGSIIVPNGGSINFDAGSVINPQTKAPYTGTVAVSAFWLNPTTDNFLEIMPGDLRGIDENDKQVGLQSFGMMVVELTGAAGEKLQLSGSKPATMKFPIAPAQQASAPATIAFWSFNDTTGLWKQEGMATRQGNEYIGKASHFSFWNVDAPFALVDFKATIKDQNGTPIKGVKVSLKTSDDEFGPSASSNTDSEGALSGLIPYGKKLKLTLLGYCQYEPGTIEIGPFYQAADLGVIPVTIPSDKKYTISGEVLDCEKNPMKDGYVEFNINGTSERAPIVNGILNHSFNRCDTVKRISFKVVDTANSIGELQTVNVTGNSISLGKITFCAVSSAEYLIVTTDDTTYTLFPSGWNLVLRKTNEKTFHIQRWVFEDFIDIFFSVNEADLSAIGLYSRITINKSIYKIDDPFSIQIIEFGKIGEYISGTFSGFLSVEYTNTPRKPITGKFRLKYSV